MDNKKKKKKVQSIRFTLLRYFNSKVNQSFTKVSLLAIILFVEIYGFRRTISFATLCASTSENVSSSGSGGLLGEITMVQLYGVALTAGKAHKDHKHHHAHHYEHDTTNNTPRPTRPPVTGPPLPQHPYLTAGQINHQVRHRTHVWNFERQNLSLN